MKDSSTNFSTPFANEIPSELHNFGFLVQWCEFVADRKERKLPLTKRAAGTILRTLAERPEAATGALKTSIVRGWRGFEWAWIDRNSPQKPKPKTGKALSDSMNIG